MIEVAGTVLQVWSAGPIFGTVWATDPGGIWRVVRLAARGKPDEIVEYDPPPRITEFTEASIELAREITHRERRCVVREDPYLSEVQGKPDDRHVVRPEPGQVAAARQILELHNATQAARQAYRLGHTATNAIGEARLLELLHQTVTKVDEMPCATETGFSGTVPTKT